jgi:hypothetical protein
MLELLRILLSVAVIVFVVVLLWAILWKFVISQNELVIDFFDLNTNKPNNDNDKSKGKPSSDKKKHSAKIN